MVRRIKWNKKLRNTFNIEKEIGMVKLHFFIKFEKKCNFENFFIKFENTFEKKYTYLTLKYF